MWVTVQDADLSTHLGQSGLLLDIIMNKGKIGAVGSRRAREAVMVRPPVQQERRPFLYTVVPVWSTPVRFAI